MKDLLVLELENYKYDYQYLQERIKSMEVLRKELLTLKAEINDMRIKKNDTYYLELKLNTINDRLKKEEEYLTLIIEKKNLIENRIELMPQPAKTILYFKYIKDYSFDIVAEKMSYSSKRIYQLHKEALNLYCKKYANKTLVEISKN